MSYLRNLANWAPRMELPGKSFMCGLVKWFTAVYRFTFEIFGELITEADPGNRSARFDPKFLKTAAVQVSGPAACYGMLTATSGNVPAKTMRIPH